MGLTGHWPRTRRPRAGVESKASSSADRHRIRSSLIKEDFEELILCLQKPNKESCWWVAVPSGASWEANSCGRCFRPHCAVQARARCTEIRGDLDPTVFSRWPPAQQPPRPAAGQGGDQGRALGVKIGDVSAGGARSGKEVDPGSRPHLHPAEAPADPPAFFDPAWSIWLLRRVGNSYVTRDDCTSAGSVELDARRHIGGDYLMNRIIAAICRASLPSLLLQKKYFTFQCFTSFILLQWRICMAFHLASSS